MILADPSRAVAAPLTEARVQEVMSRAAPDALITRTLRDLSPAIGELTADQKENVAIATDQAVRDPKSVPALERALGDSEPVVRGAACPLLLPEERHVLGGQDRRGAEAALQAIHHFEQGA